MEPFELFDGDGDKCKPRESKSENEENHSIFDTDLLENIPIELTVHPKQRMIGNTVALAGII